MQDIKGNLSCLDFSLDLREAGFKVIPKEKFSFFLVFLTLPENVNDGLTLFLYMLMGTLIVKIHKFETNLLVGLDVGADDIVTIGNVLKKIGFGDMADQRNLHEL
jgi:hypothetical protein